MGLNAGNKLQVEYLVSLLFLYCSGLCQLEEFAYQVEPSFVCLSPLPLSM
jgi:hypothetical protein